MEKIIGLALCLFITSCSAQNSEVQLPADLSEQIAPAGQNAGTYTDARDGQMYAWSRLQDGQVWMIQNLNFEAADSWCYKNNDSLCAHYGRLYSWEAARDACPEGWHLPSDMEWKRLALAYGGYYNYETLSDVEDKEKSYAALIDTGESGFLAQLGGIRYSADYYNYIDEYASYWTSYEFDYEKAWSYQFKMYKFLGRYTQKKKEASSCRCVLGPKHKSAPFYHYGTFTDARDGQIYNWVRLRDGKKWMVQNLNFETKDSWCYEENNKNCQEYGRLYTWKAALKACPKGWHVPSDAEWWEMANHYGMPWNDMPDKPINKDQGAGEEAVLGLYETGETGFRPQLSGMYFNEEVGFDHLNDFAYHWTSSSLDEARAIHYDIIRKSYLRCYGLGKSMGMACRCVED